MKSQHRQPAAASAASIGHDAGEDVVQTRNIYALPTREELTALKETASLFRSNIFRMQLDATLAESRLSPSMRSAAEEVLTELKRVLDSATDDAASVMTAPATVKLPGKVRPPVVLGAALEPVQFQFLAPTQIHVVGSFLLRAGLGLDANIDLAVTMPAAMFQPKDRMNHRYQRKRALFVARLAALLVAQPRFEEARFTCAQGDPLRPVIEVRPRRPDGKVCKFTVRIYPVIDAVVFAVDKLGPTCNNVRWEKCAALLPAGCARVQAAEETATPHVNNAILADMYPRLHLQMIHDFVTTHGCPGFLDGVALLKIWLRQQCVNSADFGAFNGFAATMLVLHLFQARTLSKDSSSYQVFKATVAFIAGADWTKSGVFMTPFTFEAHFPDPLLRPSQESFHAGFDVVFVDPSGFYNLLGQMNKWAASSLLAAQSLIPVLLDSPLVDRLGRAVFGARLLLMAAYPAEFSPLFLARTRIEEQFDCLLRVRVTPAVARTYGPQLLDRGDWLSFARHFVLTVLAQALSDRVDLIAPLPVPDAANAWPVTQSPTHASAKNEGVIVVGLTYNRANYRRLLDAGPPSDSPQAATFRNFWGPMAELRRFPDGSISESVSWATLRTPAAAHLLPADIAAAALVRHGRIAPDGPPALTVAVDIVSTADVFGELLSLDNTLPDDAEQRMQKITQSFDKLSRELQALDGLPLFIVTLHGVSASFRFTELFPPPLPAHCLQAPLEVVIHFESSGNWPENVSAIQSVKAAFYVRIAELFTEKHKVETVVTESFVDLFFDGFVFRLFIHVDREMHLELLALEGHRAAAAAARESGIAQPDLAAAEGYAERRCARVARRGVHLPAHASFCHGLELANVGFGAIARLAKRWVASHMLCSELSDEAVELLVASLFVNATTAGQPSSLAPGFLRFLVLLGNTDWLNEPLIVNTTGELTHMEHASVAQHFRENRAQLPAMFIATAGDQTSRWTHDGPSAQMLVRIVAFAQASAAAVLALLRSLQATGACTDERVVFRTSLADYAVVLHLKPTRLPTAAFAVDAPGSTEEAPGTPVVFKNLIKAGTAGVNPVGFDPAALLLADLKQRFGHVALFFYDAYGGRAIGVVWKPSATAPHPFKLAFTTDCMPVATTESPSEPAPKKRKPTAVTNKPQVGNNMIVLNKAATLEAFRVLGRGIVDRIENREATAMQ